MNLLALVGCVFLLGSIMAGSVIGLANFGILGAVLGAILGAVFALSAMCFIDYWTSRRVRPELRRLRGMTSPHIRTVLRDENYATPSLALLTLVSRKEPVDSELEGVLTMLMSDSVDRRKAGMTAIELIYPDVARELIQVIHYRADDTSSRCREKINSYRMSTGGRDVNKA